MAKPGHVPLTNHAGLERGRVRLEAAVAQLTPKPKPTLPYYKRQNPRGRILNESFVESAEADTDTQPLPDVAVASLGTASTNIVRSPRLLEAVIGTDDRQRVSSVRMTMDPFRQICALRIRSAGGRMYVGTGWFIAAKVLATAGHCVFLQDDGGWADSITVIAAKDGPTEKYGTVVSKRFGSPDGWVKERNSNFDYGVIFLDDAAVGNRVGNFEVQALMPSALKALDAQISGYPADRDHATVQYFHTRPLIDVTESRIVYDIDTFGGQSGSPIWQESEELGLVAVGIHTTGGVSSNSGTRITDDVLDNLIGWIA